MSTGTWQRAGIAGLLAASLTACAHEEPTRTAAAPPPPSPEAAKPAPPPTLQEQLVAATSDLEGAERDIATAQQQLAEAERRQQEARAKVGQLELQARQDLERARQLAFEAEQAQGLQAAVGRVAEATPSRVLLRLPDGRSVSFQIDDRTRVIVGSEQRSVADIQQGAEARVAYDPTGAEPKAVTIRIGQVGREMGVTPAAPPPPAAAQPR
jgi:hypothetical protein